VTIGARTALVASAGGSRPDASRGSAGDRFANPEFARLNIRALQRPISNCGRATTIASVIPSGPCQPNLIERAAGFNGQLRQSLIAVRYGKAALRGHAARSRGKPKLRKIDVARLREFYDALRKRVRDMTPGAINIQRAAAEPKMRGQFVAGNAETAL
jgi:hypothetical protein